MSRCTRKLALFQPARYQFIIVGHLDPERATWFERLTLVNRFGEDGTPITTITGKVLDQAMLHGLLTRIRDLGLPLLAVNRIKSDKNKVSDTE
jgi:hypothetical protein